MAQLDRSISGRTLSNRMVRSSRMTTEENHMREDLPVWRSLLFVPVNVDKFVRTGADRGADGIILDLAGAVGPSEKDHARTLIADAIPHVSRNGADVLVRVNRPWRMLVRDIEASVIPGVCALM